MPKEEAEMTDFTFQMDRETRDAYGRLCDSLGLTMSSATLALIKQAIRDQGICLSLRDENRFTPDEAAELRRRVQAVRRGKKVQHVDV